MLDRSEESRVMSGLVNPRKSEWTFGERKKKLLTALLYGVNVRAKMVAVTRIHLPAPKVPSTPSVSNITMFLRITKILIERLVVVGSGATESCKPPFAKEERRVLLAGVLGNTTTAARARKRDM